MKSFNSSQKLLLPTEDIYDIHPHKKYQILFSHLALQCGLITGTNPHTVKQHLSFFLRNTPNLPLQKIKNILITELISLGEINGHFLSIDSCHILANFKENNLKTSVRDRFKKSKIPKGDPDARLGVLIHFKKNSDKKIEYFWGYLNHVVLDAISELPVAEIAKPANVSEQTLFIPLFNQVQNSFHFPVKEVLADAMYDVESILKFVINDLRALPRIARNPRWQIHSDVKPAPMVASFVLQVLR